jgi:hypothetical protein
MDQSKTPQSDAQLAIPRAHESHPVSERTSAATLAPEEPIYEKNVDDVDVKDGAPVAESDANDDDNYFHGMQLMPVFVALILAVFLIAIDQVCCSPVHYACSSVPQHNSGHIFSRHISPPTLVLLTYF